MRDHFPQRIALDASTNYNPTLPVSQEPHMSEERYADAIGEIALVGSTVRIDLMSLSNTEKDDKGQPKLVFRQRIVMPVDGFLHSFGLMARVMQQLEKQGVIKRQPIDGKNATVIAETPAASPKSTNFK